MAQHFFHRLLIVVVHLVHALGLLVLGSAGKNALLKSSFSDICSEISVIGNILSNDVHSTLNSFCRIIDALFRINKSSSLFCQRLCGLLCQKNISQSFKPFFSGNAGSCLSLWSIWKVKILNGNHRLRSNDLGLKFVCHLALLLNRSKNLLTPLFKTAQILESLIEITKLLIVQRSCNFLPVPGNERDCVALIDQLDCRLNLPLLNA